MRLIFDECSAVIGCLRCPSSSLSLEEPTLGSTGKKRVPGRTREETRLDAISEAYWHTLLEDQILGPLKELNEVYYRFGSHGPTPLEFAKAWVAWKDKTFQKGRAVKSITAIRPGCVQFEYDTDAPTRTVVRELSTYLKAIKSFTDWGKSGLKGLPKSTGSRAEHPINWQDFLQDGTIVILRNAGLKYDQIAKILRMHSELGWPRQQVVAVNRLKKRMKILRSNLGDRFLPATPAKSSRG